MTTGNGAAGRLRDQIEEPPLPSKMPGKRASTTRRHSRRSSIIRPSGSSGYHSIASVGASVGFIVNEGDPVTNLLQQDVPRHW